MSTTNGPVNDRAVHPIRTALMVTSAVWIGGFIVAAAFARGLMAERVFGPISLGWAWALSIPVFVLAVTAVQARLEDTTR